MRCALPLTHPHPTLECGRHTHATLPFPYPRIPLDIHPPSPTYYLETHLIEAWVPLSTPTFPLPLQLTLWSVTSTLLPHSNLTYTLTLSFHSHALPLSYVSLPRNTWNLPQIETWVPSYHPCALPWPPTCHLGVCYPHSTHTPHESSRFPSQTHTPFGNLRSICWNEMETSHLKLETCSLRME